VTRLLAGRPDPEFTEFCVAGEKGAFTLTYRMHLRIVVEPTFVTPVASVCLARGDRVYELLDYSMGSFF
jgi:hypothetical protein